MLLYLFKWKPPRTLFRRQHFSSYFITTPIFYVNAEPHMGHLYTALIADAAVRFQLLLKEDASPLFSTGTDEHGSKIQKAAESSNTSPGKYCSEISKRYQSLFDSCGIKYTHFIRTSDAAHKEAVQHFWIELEKRGHITPGSYSGWYCSADEAFLTDLQLKTVKNADNTEMKVSAESGRAVEWTEESNFKFNLGKFIPDVLHWLKTEQPVEPKPFYDLLLHWITELQNEGFTDLSVSRPSSRVHWGIQVPGHPEQTIYVWLDALVNYLTVAGYPKNLSKWPPDVHVLGKDILKFHGLYWPAFLIAAGLEPPRKLQVHAHWTVDGEKMSKSVGNVINPFEKIESFSVSGYRYFLLREGTPHSDANYSETKILRMLNSELADSLGNLLNRCTGSAINVMQAFPAFSASEFDKLRQDNSDLADLANRIENLQDEVRHHYEAFNFYKGIEYTILTVHVINRFFEHCEPWNLKKDPAKSEKLRCVLHATMESLRICAIALSPVIPVLSSTLLDKLSVAKDKRSWKNLVPSWKRKDFDEDLALSKEKVVLFQRIK
ncbi:unnamed protein product [Bemisia tabaci]|uniref:Methionine--tRNA ligase, mitochondrial n=1 Tax=Bemisia tabaci TaxID=7038 RepID=A0A9P0F923_BEMTA|nr:unnamed protein product [Bemisia tabaci]